MFHRYSEGGDEIELHAMHVFASGTGECEVLMIAKANHFNATAILRLSLTPFILTKLAIQQGCMKPPQTQDASIGEASSTLLVEAGIIKIFFI